MVGTNTGRFGLSGRAGTKRNAGIDPLAPGALTIVRMTAATDSGSSNSDAITFNTSPAFQIDLPAGYGDARDATAGDVVRYYFDSVSQGTYTLLSGDISGGSWNFGASALSDSVRALTARLERGARIGPLSNSYSFTVDTTAPTISTSSSAIVAENTALAVTLAANETVTWSISGGADQAKFEISGTTLRFAANGTKNYESPDDADTNNTYVVQVTATDLAGNATNKTITVTVTDLDETAPTITTSSTANVAENATLSVALTANETVTWAITGGADQSKFEISGTTLRWAGNGTKNYEAPDDADTNNTYVVQVTATDLALNATNKTITVTVTDVDEVAPTVSVLTPLDGATSVSVSNNLTVQFSENVSFHSVVSIGIYKSSDDSTVETFSASDIGTKISISGDTLTINPSSDFANSTDYYVLIGSTSIKDAADNYFAGIASKTTWNFTTDAAASFSLAQVASAQDAAGGTTINYGTVNIGANDADRIVLVGFSARIPSQVSSCSLGGVAGTQVPGVAAVAAGNIAVIDWWYWKQSDLTAGGVTGTSAALSATYNASTTRSNAEVYRIKSTTHTPATSPAGTSNTAGNSLTSPSVTVPSGGGAVAMYMHANPGNANDISWSNAVKDHTAIQIGTFMTSGVASVSATGTVGASISGASNGIVALAVVAWGP